MLRQLSASAVAIVVVCAVTLYSGVKLVVFSQEFDRVDDALSASSDNPSRPTDGQLHSFLATWKNEPGVSDLARRLSLWRVRSVTPNDKAAIEDAVSEIIENSPTYTWVWQDLAEARLARSASMESVIAAFRMSDLTGSHEGYAMIRRAAFGLEHWTELPETDRRIVVRDVLATIGPPYRPGLKRYHEIIVAKPDGERENIRAALTASGFATPGDVQALSE